MMDILGDLFAKDLPFKGLHKVAQLEPAETDNYDDFADVGETEEVQMGFKSQNFSPGEKLEKKEKAFKGAIEGLIDKGYEDLDRNKKIVVLRSILEELEREAEEAEDKPEQKKVDGDSRFVTYDELKEIGRKSNL